MGNYEKDYEHEDICAFQARQVLKSSSPRLQRAMTVLTLLPITFVFAFLQKYITTGIAQSGVK